MKPRKLAALAEKEGLSEKEYFIRVFNRLGSQAEVAAALGVSQSTISQWIRDLNLKMQNVLVEKESENV